MKKTKSILSVLILLVAMFLVGCDETKVDVQLTVYVANQVEGLPQPVFEVGLQLLQQQLNRELSKHNIQLTLLPATQSKSTDNLVVTVTSENWEQELKEKLDNLVK